MKGSIDLDLFIVSNKDSSYSEIMDEIIKYQDALAMSDAKARKINSKKNLSKDDKTKISKIRKEIREEIIKEMEKTSILDKILTTINNVSKAVKSLAKMMVYIIGSLFSVDIIKANLNDNTLSIMEQIYDKSLKVYSFFK